MILSYAKNVVLMFLVRLIKSIKSCAIKEKDLKSRRNNKVQTPSKKLLTFLLGKTSLKKNRLIKLSFHAFNVENLSLSLNMLCISNNVLVISFKNAKVADSSIPSFSLKSTLITVKVSNLNLNMYNTKKKIMQN